jgi:predicted nuclease of predicted toxin-antitoxin system
MKLLFDENLSFRLVDAISQLFPGSVHITRTGLTRGTSDRTIWEYAGQNDFAIVTADSDFVALANTLGHPPKVILLENCDYPTDSAARVLSTNAIRISEFERNDRPVLILRRQ